MLFGETREIYMEWCVESKRLYFTVIHWMNILATSFVRQGKHRGVSGKGLRQRDSHTNTRRSRYPQPSFKPIYARLSNPDLLKKCLHGYHQNANEFLHSLVRRFSPKTLHMGSNSVELACAMAVLSLNNGSASPVCTGKIFAKERQG